MKSTALNAPRRTTELAEATDGRTADLLVVGLGVTGAGVALDAAARGLDVVAVDAHDLAFGTSRWSSKLVHGGLRYLAQGHVGLARESAVERGILMEHTAPHLVSAAPWVMPLTAQVSARLAAFAWSGLRAGDLLRAGAGTSHRTLPRPRRLTAVETLAWAPMLRRESLRGGLLSWDGQLSDDVRLVIALARTAAGRGARILTRVRALSVTGGGAEVRDELTGAELVIRARAVVNATGVWAGGLVPDVHLRPSRGSHLVLSAAALPGLRSVITAPVAGERSRFVLVLPQADGRVYVGLTDEPVEGPLPDVPTPTDAEVDYLLDLVNDLVEAELTRVDVIGAFAGLRPLLEADGRTSDLSRSHAVLVSGDDVVTVVGGKLTTYRRMAEDAVDAAVRTRGLRAGSCRTTRLPLVGAADPATLAGLGVPRRLIGRYGVESVRVASLPGAERQVADGVPYTHAELAFGVSHEGALDVDDLLDRRTRIGLAAKDRATAEAAAESALSLVS
ncbi:MAG: glycerol-3-phosphate dehydrogenase/oxidase [Nocardioidaceae bacterium]